MSPSQGAVLTATGARQPDRSRRRDRQDRHQPTLIWTLGALVQWGATVSVCAIVAMGAWYNASGKASFAQQVPAINVAVIALVISSAASIGLLLAGRRAIGLRRQALLGEPSAVPVASKATVVIPVQATRTSSVLIGGPNLSHYHRSDCSMAVGRDWPAASATDHAREGRTPCGVCQP
jgi:hypothetical protein